MGDVQGNPGQFEAWAAHGPTMPRRSSQDSRRSDQKGVKEFFRRRAPSSKAFQTEMFSDPFLLVIESGQVNLTPFFALRESGKCT